MCLESLMLICEMLNDSNNLVLNFNNCYYGPAMTTPWQHLGNVVTCSLSSSICISVYACSIWRANQHYEAS